MIIRTAACIIAENAVADGNEIFQTIAEFPVKLSGSIPLFRALLPGRNRRGNGFSSAPRRAHLGTLNLLSTGNCPPHRL